MATNEAPARPRARELGPLVLAAVIHGESLGDIADNAGKTQTEVEDALRKELRKRWIAPVQDYARLQIVRLETLAMLLRAACEKGHLPAIDRLLKVLDRLDRYHGFSKLAGLPAPHDENLTARLIEKMNQASGAGRTA